MIDGKVLVIKLERAARCEAACVVFLEWYQVFVCPEIHLVGFRERNVFALFEGQQIYFWLFHLNSWLIRFLILLFFHLLLIGFVFLSLPVFFKHILALEAQVAGLAFKFPNEV